MNMLNLFLAAVGSVAAGDDTPVLLYAVLGAVALLLVIAAIVLGKKTKKK
ncbi:MAG: LPXTG cell wall anchor domain-containing protein [Oscillospiraceae bacterium]|nr:LPXTG cell wall anchor domain-containing protein [Oscillospiraceae bacterium]